MKNKGIVKIDDVGRLVIPKSIRNMLQLKDKLVEVYVENDKLIIKRYAPLSLCDKIIRNLCKKVAHLTGAVCIVGDSNKLTVVSSENLRFLEGKQISYELKAKMSIENEFFVTNLQNNVPIFENESLEYFFMHLVTIKDENTQVGFIAILQIENREIKEKEIFALKIAKELFLSAITHEKMG